MKVENGATNQTDIKDYVGNYEKVAGKVGGTILPIFVENRPVT